MPRARSDRSSPSRRSSCASTAASRICGSRSPTASKIQLLTTRDTSDPDALAVLRHSSAHLLAEAVRRLYPGVKVAIGPPIENGFYYDFDFPEPIREEDLERIQAEIARELEGGSRAGRARRSRATRRASASRRRASRTRSSSSTPPRGTSPCTRRRGGVHRPVPRPAPAGLEADQGAEAHRPRRRVLARRLDEAAADAHLRHRVLRPEGSGRVPRAAGGGAQARPSPARRNSSISSTSRALARGRRCGIRRGWRSTTRSRICAGARTRSAATPR